MKALSLTQPWATLVALGAKRIETRSWRTNYRGPLAIHAAKGMLRVAADLCFTEPFCRYVARPSVLPRGAVVAIVRLVGCVPIHGAARPSEGSEEYAFGDYGSGRFMWLLDDIVALAEAVPARGALGLWEWSGEV